MKPRKGAVKPRTLLVPMLMAVVIAGLGTVSGSAKGEVSALAKTSNKVKPTPASFTTTSSVADGSTLSGSLTWTATPKGASVQKVEFLIDGATRWTENWAPYQFNGDTGALDTTTLSDGTHTLAVVAYAVGGQTVVAKASVKVSNSVPPPPAFTTTSSVAGGSTLSGSLTWTATPKGASVQKVEFLIDGALRWTEYSAPYQFNGDTGALDTTTLSDGTHTLAVVAYAVNGRRTATVQSSVTVSNKSNLAYPSAPTDLHVTDSSQQTSLTAAWTAVTGAAGYRVGRNGVALADTARTTYTWTGLTCGTTYSLTVQPETSTSDTRGKVATGSATTASCAPSGGGGGGDGGGGGNPVAFKGDFEPGDISQWQSTSWGGAQCLNYGLPNDSNDTYGDLYVLGDIVAKGSYSGRVDLPAAGTSNACELLRGRTIAMDDEWYSMEVRFPSNWQEPSPAGWGMVLAQFNFEGIWGFPLGISAHSNYVGLTLNSGLCKSITSGDPTCQYSSGIQGNVPSQYIIPISDFSTGVWHQLLIHVKWTNGNDGIVEGFHRLRGQTTWTRTVSFIGYPTLQRTSTFTPVAADRTVDKIGAYRGAASFSLSIWQDNFCQATSMAAAESCF